MIRIFEHPTGTEWKELVLIDDEKDLIKIYCQNKQFGFPFSEYTTSLNRYGYTSAEVYKRTMKQRDNVTIEVDVNKQLESERIGLINLKVEQERIRSNPEEYNRRLAALGMGGK
jgi:hypothetical protein